jgi:hypothetical protein
MCQEEIYYVSIRRESIKYHTTRNILPTTHKYQQKINKSNPHDSLDNRFRLI